jgi:hypothetical protein
MVVRFVESTADRQRHRLPDRRPGRSAATDKVPRCGGPESGGSVASHERKKCGHCPCFPDIEKAQGFCYGKDRSSMRMVRTVTLNADIPLNRELHIRLPADVPTGGEHGDRRNVVQVYFVQIRAAHCRAVSHDTQLPPPPRAAVEPSSPPCQGNGTLPDTFTPKPFPSAADYTSLQASL